jgi:hypothetical protein
MALISGWPPFSLSAKPLVNRVHDTDHRLGDALESRHRPPP